MVAERHTQALKIAVAAGVKEQVLAAALPALGEVAPESRRAAAGDGTQGTHVARQHRAAMTRDVSRAVARHHIGEAEHGCSV